MRSIVTEPLLTHMRDDPNGSFDVIISLNEFCKDGMAGALATVEALAREWGVALVVSNYVFATLGRAHRDWRRNAEGEATGAQCRRVPHLGGQRHRRDAHAIGHDDQG
jgi:hypothetical protein